MDLHTETGSTVWIKNLPSRLQVDKLAINAYLAGEGVTKIWIENVDNRC